MGVARCWIYSFFLRLVVTKQSAAFGGEAVFLQAAVGFVGNGAFDEGGGEGGFEVASFKVFAPAQGQC